MTPCPSCGSALTGESAILGMCVHHKYALGDEWAANNRLMCDLLHRGRVPARLPAGAREELFWADVADVA